MAQRLKYVEDLMIVCTPRADIVDLTMSQFEVSEITAVEYMQRVRVRWNAEAEAARPSARATLQAKIEHQQYLAQIDGDRRAMVDLLKLEADLHGLRSQQRVHTSSDGSTPVEALTPEQRRAEIARFEAKKQEAEMAAATQH